MAHDEFHITWRARCAEPGCDWDSDEQPNEGVLMAAVDAHHEIECHPDRLLGD